MQVGFLTPQLLMIALLELQGACGAKQPSTPQHASRAPPYSLQEAHAGLACLTVFSNMFHAPQLSTGYARHNMQQLLLIYLAVE